MATPRTRIRTLLCALGLLASALAAAADGGALKVLRYAFPAAESGFDPAQVTDLYSKTVICNIFDAPLEFAYLTQPAAVRPNTAAALPEPSDNFRRWVFTIRPGIFFADDPAFNGHPRELTAADYVYAIKRHFDPRWKSGVLFQLDALKILGLAELRRDSLAAKKPFDYDHPVEGLRALDRYRFELRLGDPAPRLPYLFADASLVGAVAREVVERWGDTINEHPVGTGPFRLAAWQRSARIVLERNPRYRERLYAEQPAVGDAARTASARALAGRRLPMVDRVEIGIVEEPQPRWLSFLNAEADVIDRLPDEFAPIAMPGNRLAPHLARRGMAAQRFRRADGSFTYFAMEHPVVGGYTPERVALRRAISLAIDTDAEIRLVRGGQAVTAQGIVPPQVWGHDPALKTEMGDFSRARANALLDTYGWVDRDGDGWREQPDGQPLVIEFATSPDATFRALYEQWHLNMKAIGIRTVPLVRQWPEQLKASRAGKLMVWGVSWSATVPDAEDHLALGYGPNKGQANHARFDLPAYNRLFEAQRALPDGPERAKLVAEANRLLVAYMPYKVHVHRIWTDITQPWLKGYHRNLFARDWWRYVDVEPRAGP